MGTVRSIEDVLEGLTKATARLIGDVGRLADADVREPSLLPGWTRGHVLTHLARNAQGGARLLGWAWTGIPSYEYPSVAARAAAIERGRGGPLLSWSPTCARRRSSCYRHGPLVPA